MAVSIVTCSRVAQPFVVGGPIKYWGKTKTKIIIFRLISDD